VQLRTERDVGESHKDKRHVSTLYTWETS